MAKKSQSVLNGALILSLAILAVKIIGIFFKVYVTYQIGLEGKSYYATAYNIYTPIYTIALAGLPTAVSKMVASRAAEGRYKDVKKLFNVSVLLFSLFGVVGMVLIAVLAVPFASSQSDGVLNAVPAILAIAPSLFFCCVMSGYRGYYQGLGNMTPSAISQVFEAGGKLIFGWLLINVVVGTGATFADKIPYLNTIVTEKVQAWSAAAAIAGVTIGSLMGLLYLMLRHRFEKNLITQGELDASPDALSFGALSKELMKIAIPIAVSSLIFNVTTLIDNWVIPNRLMAVLSEHFDTVAAMYPGIVSSQGYTAADAVAFKDYLYGAYDTVIEIKNIVPTFTITLGLSAIPVLSAAWTKRKWEEVNKAVDSVIRLTLLIAYPAGCGMVALADDILELIYGSSETISPAIPYIAPILMLYGVSVVFLALTQPITNMLQAVNRADVPIKAMAIGAIVKIVANFLIVSVPSINIQGAVLGSILCNIIMVAYGLVVLKKETGLKYDIMGTFLKPLFCAVLSGIAAWGVDAAYNRFLPEEGLGGLLNAANLGVIAGVFAAIVTYVLALLATHSIPKEDILMLPMGRKIAKCLAKFGLIE